jgi:hypothetical protein
MNYYSIALFLHIVGALGFFTALGLEWMGLRQIRNATSSDQIREWIGISNTTRRIGMGSMLTILAAGIYMMAADWGLVAWIIVALGAMILLAVLGITITGPRIAALGRTLTLEKGPLPHTLRNLANDPFLWISMQIRVAISLGIVFLMTVKPGLAGSLLVIGIATILGIASALPMPHRERAQERPG